MNLTDFEKMMEEDNEIFFDLEEFAEMHSINKKQVRVIIDNNERLEQEKKADMKDKEGLSKKKLLFYVIGKEFGALPPARSLLEFDNQLYKIIDAINENGIYSITLEVYSGK